MTKAYCIKVDSRGTAKLYENGNSPSTSTQFHQVRTYGTTDKVKSGVVQGDTVALTMENGSVRIYTLEGRFVQKI